MQSEGDDGNVEFLERQIFRITENNVGLRWNSQALAQIRGLLGD